MIEIYLLFKLNFLPYLIFTKNDVIFFVGNKIEAYKKNKKLYSTDLKSEFINTCKSNDDLFILTSEGIYKFDYENNRIMNFVRGNFSDISCSKSRILAWKDSIFAIFDLNLKIISEIKGKYNVINDFIILSDTIPRKISLLSISSFDTLEIRNFEMFLPYFGKQDSIYALVAGLSKRNFYLYFFEDRKLRWYNKISTKIIISDLKLDLDERTILIYGSSQRTFYLNLKDLMGDDIWVYNPRVLGVYYLDETFRDVLIENNKIVAYGYSMREGQKRGVIKIVNYHNGEEIFQHFDKEIEDILKIIKVENEFYLLGITKKFLGVYKLNLNSLTKSD